MNFDLIIQAKAAVSQGLKSAGAQIKQFASANAASLESAFNAIKQIGQTVAVAGGAIAGAIGVVLNAYSKQQKAENDLNSALIAHGSNATALMPKYKALASAIQDQTGAADENTLSLMTQIKNLGVTDDKMEEATKGALGLAKALGLDQAAAARYAALALNGEFTTLQRYIPALREANDDGEKMAIVQNLMAQGYEQQQASLNTVSGRFGELKGRVGDFLEKIGEAITNSSGMESVLASLSERVVEIGARFQDWVDVGGLNRLTASVKIFASEFITRFLNIKDSAAAVFGAIYDMGAAPFLYVGNIIGSWANMVAAQFEYVYKYATEIGRKLKHPFSYTMDLPSADVMKESMAGYWESFANAAPFKEIAENFDGLSETITKREAEHARTMQQIESDYLVAEEKRIANAETKAVETAQAAGAAKLDAEMEAAEAVSEKQIEAAEEVAEVMAEAQTELLEEKKTAEMKIVEDAAKKQAEISGDVLGAATEIAKSGKSVGASDVREYTGYEMTAAQHAEEERISDIVKALGDAMKDVSPDYTGLFKELIVHSAKTSNSIEGALSMG
jgi:hypothetical protein